ncbi:SURF1 family cytochrome oxidase biogenesis protein [Agromyces seonyuensis]|nr:SURF1 family cytochrome oxidase biogenesis protein [Agromyces seonyuensis]
MMLRPRWVLALLLALGVAAAFAALGQWQVERAVEEATVVERDTETVKDLAVVAETDVPTRQTSTGQLVRAEGTWVPGDGVLVQNRLNGGVAGWWAVAHFEVAGDAEPGGMPVALGWAPTEAEAADALAAFDESAALDGTTIEGRFLPSEAPEMADAQAGIRTTVAIADLVNVWADYDGRAAYFAYVTLGEAPAGLTTIDSPAPEETATLNWLNVFYAVEWVAFAGFAIFLWFRLVKDAVEREEQEAAEAALASAPVGNGPGAAPEDRGPEAS